MTPGSYWRVAAACGAAALALAGSMAAWRIMMPSDGTVLPPSPPPPSAAVASAPHEVVPDGGPAPPPPPPARVSIPGRGPLPFAIGEEARYRVLWKGGGAVELPAGEAVFRVEQGAARDGTGRPGFRLELVVTTASWISAFFEARDRFWTLTGPDLAPFVHVQELNEGRRHLTRTMTFDAGRRRTIVAAGPPEAAHDGIEYPWAPSVRDPLGAFFEARTIEIDPAARRTVSVDNVGQALTLVLRGAGLTSITAEGRAQPALVLDVRLDGQSGQPSDATARVWLSTDRRRIPLAIDVSASFGTFRVELQAYRPGTEAASRDRP